MYLRPTKIFRLDGQVIRPKRHFLIEVTKEEARSIRRACHASVWRRTEVPKGWTVLKSKGIKDDKKNNTPIVSASDSSKSAGKSKNKGRVQVSKSK